MWQPMGCLRFGQEREDIAEDKLLHGGDGKGCWSQRSGET